MPIPQQTKDITNPVSKFQGQKEISKSRIARLISQILIHVNSQKSTRKPTDEAEKIKTAYSNSRTPTAFIDGKILYWSTSRRGKNICISEMHLRQHLQLICSILLIFSSAYCTEHRVLLLFFFR